MLTFIYKMGRFTLRCEIWDRQTLSSMIVTCIMMGYPFEIQPNLFVEG